MTEQMDLHGEQAWRIQLPRHSAISSQNQKEGLDEIREFYTGISERVQMLLADVPGLQYAETFVYTGQFFVKGDESAAQAFEERLILEGLAENLASANTPNELHVLPA